MRLGLSAAKSDEDSLSLLGERQKRMEYCDIRQLL